MPIENFSPQKNIEKEIKYHSNLKNKIRKYLKILGLAGAATILPKEAITQNLPNKDNSITFVKKPEDFKKYQDSLRLFDSNVENSASKKYFINFKNLTNDEIIKFLNDRKILNLESISEYKNNNYSKCDKCPEKTLESHEEELKIIEKILKNYQETGILPEGYYYGGLINCSPVAGSGVVYEKPSQPLELYKGTLQVYGRNIFFNNPTDLEKAKVYFKKLGCWAMFLITLPSLLKGASYEANNLYHIIPIIVKGSNSP